MITRLLKFFAYVAGVAASCHYADGPWVVGPAFALVVIAWDSNLFRAFSLPKHLGFAAASTLIYALVFEISSQNWTQGSDLAASLYGSLPVAIIVGSTLLPFAHRYLLKVSEKLVAQTIPLLIFSYYLVAFVSFTNDHWNLDLSINFLYIMIAVWQGAYLHFMFPEKKK